MSTQNDLVCSLVTATKFYDFMKIKLNGSISSKEIKEVKFIEFQVITGINSISRYKAEEISCKFTESAYLIVVYGEFTNEGKVLRKGDYLRIEQIEKKYTFSFSRTSTLVLLNSQLVDARLHQILYLRDKIIVIQRCLPVLQLHITQPQIKEIAKFLEFRKVNGKYSRLEKQEGFFVFYQGIFQLCHNNNPALEVQNNFVQITQNVEFGIKLKSCLGKYGFIQRKTMYNIVGQDTLMEFKKLHEMREKLKIDFAIKNNYLDSAQKLRATIALKLKRSKILSVCPQSSNKKEIPPESLASSRKTILQKCSTALTTSQSFSLISPTKTVERRLKSLSTPSKKKSRQSPEKSRNINLSMSEQKLRRMREVQGLKKQTQLQKKWYHLDPSKTMASLDCTYWKINKSQHPKEAKALCNFKRIHRIFSDPCFKKGINFRNF